MLNGRPWLFDTYLFNLKPFDGCTSPSQMNFHQENFWIKMHDLPLSCMNAKIGSQIGNSIGEVKNCEVQVDDTRWGKVLRMFIEIDLTKLLPRGHSLNLKGNKMCIPL